LPIVEWQCRVTDEEWLLVLKFSLVPLLLGYRRRIVILDLRDGREGLPGSSSRHSSHHFSEQPVEVGSVVEVGEVVVVRRKTGRELSLVMKIKILTLKNNIQDSGRQWNCMIRLSLKLVTTLLLLL